MVAFTDKNGKQRIIELTIGSAKRIKAKTSVDLVNPIEKIDGKTAFERITENPLLLCDILYEMLSEPDKTETEFADCLDGDSIQRAYSAFESELLNFSLPQVRLILEKIMEISAEVGQSQAEELKRIPSEIGTRFMESQV